MTPDDVLIRPATLEDRSFVIDSWLRSYRNSEFGRRIPDDAYGSRYGHAGFVEDVVGAGWVVVAALPSDPSFIYAFAVWDAADRLHYVYTKKDYRHGGLAKQLMGARVVPGLMLVERPLGQMTVTAETPAWKAFAAKHGIAYEYRHPYRKER